MMFLEDVPVQPDPKDWLESRDYSQCIEGISGMKSLLVQTATIKPLLEYWVRSEVSKEFTPSELELYDPSLNTLQADWLRTLEKRNASDGMPLEDRKEKIRVNFLSLEWAKKNWNFKTESIFLDNKRNLDTVKCGLIRVSSKNLAIEIYHRIKAGELSLEEASTHFGEGPESDICGLLKVSKLRDLPYGLDRIVARADPGQITMPMRLSDKFAIVQVLEKSNCVLDSATETLILQNQLDLWIGAVTQLLLSKLEFEGDATLS